MLKKKLIYKEVGGCYNSRISGVVVIAVIGLQLYLFSYFNCCYWPYLFSELAPLPPAYFALVLVTPCSHFPVSLMPSDTHLATHLQ